jgi:hypothetical protein
MFFSITVLHGCCSLGVCLIDISPLVNLDMWLTI